MDSNPMGTLAWEVASETATLLLLPHLQSFLLQEHHYLHMQLM